MIDFRYHLVSIVSIFLALAVGWWLLVVFAPIAVIGLIGWMFEFSRGQHAH